MVGHPRIAGFDRAAERREERSEGAREIAEADETHARAVKREAPLRPVEQPFLVSVPHRAVRRRHAAAEVDRHAERHLGDRPGERRAGRDHMDSALKTGLVVDVLEKVGLDVDDGAELRRTVEASLRHVALADQERHLGQIGFEALGRHAAGAFVDRELAKVLEARPDLRLEDLIQGPRLRFDHDQGFRHRQLPKDPAARRWAQSK